MERNRTSSGSISPHRIFSGVRFVLFGFDSVSEAQFRSELVRRGGTDAGRYDADCTHVIVSGRVYDDPVCVASREDGKALVTGLWVEDSINFETLADTSMVLYRPPKDLNGIPGSKKLCVCLTGYQRQEREDIMKMVSLMGARFTKPLVANEVTHLICYKFEGEKYELAKKVKIKLVNHRWLEDCLKAWELLPIDNYSKSGWELEMLEAEAKDSDEETEDPGMDLGGMSTVRTTSSRAEVPVPVDSRGLSPKMGTSSIQKKTSSSHNETPSSAVSRLPSAKQAIVQQKSSAETGCRTTEICPVENNLSSLRKEKSLEKVLDEHNEFDRQDTGSTVQKINAPPVEVAIKMEKSSTLTNNKFEKSGSKLSSHTRSTEIAPSSGGERYGTLKSIPKTPDKVILEDVHNPSCTPTKGNAGKKSPRGEENMQNETRDLQNSKSSSSLPKKRKVKQTVSRFGSKSLKSIDQQDSKVSSLHDASVNIGGCVESKLTSISLNHGVSEASDPFESAIADFKANEGSPLSGKITDLQKNAQSRLSLNKATSIPVDRGLSETSDPFEAALADFRTNEVTEPAKSKSLSYKKRSLKGRQSDCDTENAGSEGSSLAAKRTDLLQNAQSKQCLDDSTISVNRGVPDTTHPFVSALADLKSNEETSPSKSKSLSYKKRSLKRKSDGDTINAGSGGSSLAEKRTDLLQNAQARQSLEDSIVSVNRGVPETGHPFESASEDLKSNEDTAPSKAITVTYKKRSHKHVQPDTKKSGSDDSPSVQKRKKLHQNAQLKQSSDNTSNMPLNRGISETSDPFEFALTDFKSNDDAAPSKPKSLSYKKRSLKRKQSDSTTGNANSEVPDLERKTSDPSVSPGKMLRGLPPIDKPRNVAKSTSMLVGNGAAKASPKENRPEICFADPRENESNSLPDEDDDIPMTDVHCVAPSNMVEPEKNQLDKAFLPLDGENTETRKLSSTASTVNGTENAKVASGTRMKKVVGRNLGSRPKPTTEDDGKEKVDTSANRSSSKKTPLNTRKAEKVKGKSKVKKDAVDKVTVDTAAKGDKNSHREPFAETSSKKISEEQIDPGKENKPKENDNTTSDVNSRTNSKITSKVNKKSKQETKAVEAKSSAGGAEMEPIWFILSGHRLQRKEFRSMIKRLNGRCCRDSHNWSYQATHFIVPDPVRRTEKFFAAAAAGRWILKTDYLTACSEAGKFLDEKPFEWHKQGLTDGGAINLESPRKWRLVREKTGHGAFYGMRVLIYGECIAPSLDTLKRVVKAGDGTILATSPPYTKFLDSRVDYVIVSQGIPRVDSWIQEFLKHEIPCVLADYLVEYVCKVGCPLERHVQYNTNSWAEKSLARMLKRTKEICDDANVDVSSERSGDDISCSVCGSYDRGEVMMICGDESGEKGCGIGMHIDCCEPPLDAVPEGDWLCADCSGTRKKTKRKSSNSKSSLKCR